MSIIDLQEQAGPPASASDSETSESDCENDNANPTSHSVEMEIACGILELHDEAAVLAAEAAIDSHTYSHKTAQDCSSSSGSSRDDSDCESDLSYATAQVDDMAASQANPDAITDASEESQDRAGRHTNKQAPVKRRKPKIVEL